MPQPKKISPLKPRHPFTKLVDRALRRTARKVQKEAAQRGVRLVIAKYSPLTKSHFKRKSLSDDENSF